MTRQPANESAQKGRLSPRRLRRRLAERLERLAVEFDRHRNDSQRPENGDRVDAQGGQTSAG